MRPIVLGARSDPVLRVTSLTGAPVAGAGVVAIGADCAGVEGAGEVWAERGASSWQPMAAARTSRAVQLRRAIGTSYSRAQAGVRGETSPLRTGTGAASLPWWRALCEETRASG